MKNDLYFSDSTNSKILGQKSFKFLRWFFGKIKTPKSSHSEIIWPLATTNLTIGPKLDLVLKVFWFQQNGVTFVLDSKILGRLLKDVRGLHGYTISTVAFCCWSQLKCFRSFSSLFLSIFQGHWVLMAILIWSFKM